MKRILELLLLILISQTVYAQGSVNNELTHLEKTLKAGGISNIVVLRMPDDVVTRISVTPKVLREVPAPTQKYEIDVNESRSTLLLRWLKQAQLKPTEKSPDLRWGMLFIDRDGKEIGSIFSDRFGKIGNVSGENVEFSDPRLIEAIRTLVGSQARHRF